MIGGLQRGGFLTTKTRRHEAYKAGMISHKKHRDHKRVQHENRVWIRGFCWGQNGPEFPPWVAVPGEWTGMSAVASAKVGSTPSVAL